MRGYLPVLLVLAACVGPSAATLEFRLAEDEPGPGLEAVTMAAGRRTFYLHPEIVLDQTDLDTVLVVPPALPDGRATIDLRLNAEGRDAFLEFTREHMGKRCAMVVDGELLSAPLIRAPIPQGRALIQGNFTEKEAQRIATALQLAREKS